MTHQPFSSLPDEFDAEILQVFGGQLRQYRCVERVAAKSRFVLLKPETSKLHEIIHRLRDNLVR